MERTGILFRLCGFDDDDDDDEDEDEDEEEEEDEDEDASRRRRFVGGDEEGVLEGLTCLTQTEKVFLLVCVTLPFLCIEPILCLPIVAFPRFGNGMAKTDFGRFVCLPL